VVIAIQQLQFGIFFEISNRVAVAVAGSSCKQPSNVGPEQTMPGGGVQVIDRIGMPVMKSVMSRPPQHAFLKARLSQNGQKKLPDSSKFEGSMTEVTVIPGGYTKHSNGIGRNQQNDVRPFEGNPKQEEACNVERPKCYDSIEMESPDERHHSGTTLWRLQQHEP